MATIMLSDKEQQFLIELLEREIPNLRDEILHTDDSEYRDFLKERERFIKDLVHNLKTQTGAAGQS
ncbi:MAG: hypothetical protein HYZ72_16740 [Deltaproteobacteria bacterium]|nr:hypothetical protein [Deltaproteobacteria bacterium]